MFDIKLSWISVINGFIAYPVQVLHYHLSDRLIEQYMPKIQLLQALFA